MRHGIMATRKSPFAVGFVSFLLLAIPLSSLALNEGGTAHLTNSESIDAFLEAWEPTHKAEKLRTSDWNRRLLILEALLTNEAIPLKERGTLFDQLLTSVVEAEYSLGKVIVTKFFKKLHQAGWPEFLEAGKVPPFSRQQAQKYHLIIFLARTPDLVETYVELLVDPSQSDKNAKRGAAGIITDMILMDVESHYELTYGEGHLTAMHLLPWLVRAKVIPFSQAVMTLQNVSQKPGWQAIFLPINEALVAATQPAPTEPLFSRPGEGSKTFGNIVEKVEGAENRPGFKTSVKAPSVKIETKVKGTIKSISGKTAKK